MGKKHADSFSFGCFPIVSVWFLGNIVAAILSWELNRSALWMIIHCFCGWFYNFYLCVGMGNAQMLPEEKYYLPTSIEFTMPADENGKENKVQISLPQNLREHFQN